MKENIWAMTELKNNIIEYSEKLKGEFEQTSSPEEIKRLKKLAKTEPSLSKLLLTTGKETRQVLIKKLYENENIKQLLHLILKTKNYEGNINRLLYTIETASSKKIGYSGIISLLENTGKLIREYSGGRERLLKMAERFTYFAKYGYKEYVDNIINVNRTFKYLKDNKFIIRNLDLSKKSHMYIEELKLPSRLSISQIERKIKKNREEHATWTVKFSEFGGDGQFDDILSDDLSNVIRAIDNMDELDELVEKLKEELKRENLRLDHIVDTKVSAITFVTVDNEIIILRNVAMAFTFDKLKEIIEFKTGLKIQSIYDTPEGQKMDPQTTLDHHFVATSQFFGINDETIAQIFSNLSVSPLEDPEMFEGN